MKSEYSSLTAKRSASESAVSPSGMRKLPEAELFLIKGTILNLMPDAVFFRMELCKSSRLSASLSESRLDCALSLPFDCFDVDASTA